MPRRPVDEVAVRRELVALRRVADPCLVAQLGPEILQETAKLTVALYGPRPLSMRKFSRLIRNLRKLRMTPLSRAEAEYPPDGAT